MKEAKEENIKRLAYVIWQTRCRQGDPGSGNDKQNYFRAKHALYPEDMTLDEMYQL